MKELVSVIVPAYNTEEYLLRCVNSIVKQTYRNIEIILVDDGSTDRTPFLCDKIKEKYGELINVIHKENGGISSARNAGIEIASGEYLVFVDGDDWVARDFIETLYTEIKKNNCEISIVNCFLIYPDGKKRLMYPSYNMVMNREEFLHELFAQEKFGCMVCQKMYVRSIFDKIRFPEGEVYEDIAISLETFLLCNRIALCGSPKYYYFQRQSSIVNSEFSRDKLKMLSNYRDFIDFSHNNGGKYNVETEAWYLKSILLLLMQNSVSNNIDKNVVKYLERELRKHRKYIKKNKYIDTRKKIMLIFMGNEACRKLISKAWKFMMLRRYK